VVVGNSIGGFISASVAADYPDLVKGLVLVNSAGALVCEWVTAFGAVAVGGGGVDGLGWRACWLACSGVLALWVCGSGVGGLAFASGG